MLIPFWAARRTTALPHLHKPQPTPRGLTGTPGSMGVCIVSFAGTDVLGPLDSGSGLPPGARVFVATDAAVGAGTFVERTQNINPNSFRVSSSAIKTSGPTGQPSQSAYVSI